MNRGRVLAHFGSAIVIGLSRRERSRVCCLRKVRFVQELYELWDAWWIGCCCERR